MPKISIIIPIYNKEKHLENCLKSIIGQSFKDLEIILVDDGSTDNSLLISKNFQKNDKRIKVVSQKNQGVSVARNKGIEHATGEYIGFADPDDWVETDMFLKLVEKCEENNSSVSISNYFQETKNDTIVQQLDISNEVLNKNEITNQIISKLIGPLKVGEPTIMSSVWRLLVKRELIIDNNIKFPEGIHRMQDLPFSIEVLIHTNQLSVVKEPLYHYKVHDDSASSEYNVNRFEELTKVLPIIEDIVKKHNINDNTSTRINNRYLYIGIKSISNEARRSNPNSFKKALKNISKICEHEKIESAVNDIDITRYTFREKIVFNSIKKKNKLMLFSYYRLADILFH